jgi:hypothetical protein
MTEHLLISVKPSVYLGSFLTRDFLQKFSNFDGTITFIVDEKTGQILNWPGRPEHYLDELG